MPRTTKPKPTPPPVVDEDLVFTWLRQSGDDGITSLGLAVILRQATGRSWREADVLPTLNALLSRDLVTLQNGRWRLK